mmetsp:Transcript_25291/g.75930  ORF Transcript_25291/g.75930 Transcript_25291/m.75930 type:complete len:231 (+) Transcript_25291:700-1392(+)
MDRTSSFDPRGTTRSTSGASAASHASSSRATASRSGNKPTAARRAPRARSGAAATTASLTTRCSAAFESLASRPPFMTTAQPPRSASAAICGSASGRASKMTMTTPRGARRFSSTRPSLSSRFSRRRPTGSAMAARASQPLATVSSLAGDRPRRWRRCGATSPDAATSARFASRISADELRRAAPTALRIALRSAPVSPPRARAAARASSATRSSGFSSRDALRGTSREK